MSCPTDFQLIDVRIGKLLTQYRESPKLIHIIKTYMRQVEIAHQSLCELPSFFSLEKSTGDQLTIIGKRLGWLRCHCVCSEQPVFGFECDRPSTHQVSGFCDDSITWVNCGESGLGEICIYDDDMYRKFLRVRIYQLENRYDINSLNEALKILWGNEATVLSAVNGKIVITPGRDLDDSEIALLQLYPRVLPVVPQMEVLFHFDDPKVFGFGEGWGGFCSEEIEDLRLITDMEQQINSDKDVSLIVDDFKKSSNWQCQFDVKPYNC